MIYASISQIENININLTRCIEVEIKNRIRIEKNIKISKFENKFIDKVEMFFICDIAFENNVK